MLGPAEHGIRRTWDTLECVRASPQVKTAMKLVLKMPEEQVVGLHLIGQYSDEMLQGFSVAQLAGNAHQAPVHCSNLLQ